MKWIFHVYDINKDGVLSKSEIREVTAAVYRQIRNIFNNFRAKYFQVYDLMGTPSGERQKSEAVEEIITARAEMAFQVKLFIERNISSDLSPSTIDPPYSLLQDCFSFYLMLRNSYQLEKIISISSKLWMKCSIFCLSISRL